MHFAIAILNGVVFLKYVTRFSCDVFGFFVCCIYIQKGVQVPLRNSHSPTSSAHCETLGLSSADGGGKVLVSQFSAGQASGYLSIAISLLVLIVGMGLQIIGRSHLFRHTIRVIITDYGTILTIVFFTAFPHFGGELGSTTLLSLPTSQAFHTTTGRGWLVNFWTLGVGDIFLALPFAILLTILFYMDHNISVFPLIHCDADVSH